MRTNKEINELIFGGLKKLDDKGYVRVFIIERGYDCWVDEHIFIVEQKIGRALRYGENVHHINGDKQDNRIENLMPFHTMKEHSNFENEVKRFGMNDKIKNAIKNRWRSFK